MAIAANRDLVLTFDVEGIWGRPCIAGTYRLQETMVALLDLLRRQRVPAVFFVVGRLAEDHPDIVARIAAEGHEVAVHGYAHERLDQVSRRELDEVMARIGKVLDVIEGRTGVRPCGFRAPHLMGRKRFIPALYDWFERLGFRWVSNREVRYPEELVRPDRLRTNIAWTAAARLGFPLYDLALPTLNIPSLVGEWCRGHVRDGHWMRDGPPFWRGDVIEYPLLSPMDCDLIGLPLPNDPTPPALLAYARWALLERARRTEQLCTFTFHDWIIGTANRLDLLEEVLAALAGSGHWLLPGLHRPCVGYGNQTTGPL